MRKAVCVGLMLSAASFSAFGASDTGKVIEIYSYPEGGMALRLENGLPNSNAVGNCGTPGNLWAGVPPTAYATMKATMLLAKATGSEVVLVTFGQCVGGWIKIEAIHMR